MSDKLDFLDAWNRKWRTLWCWSQMYLGYKAAQARSRLLTSAQRAEYWERKHSVFAERMWSNIANLRGWWVKVGQFLSTRSDLLPVQYVHHLTKLQDMMPTSDYSIIKRTVEEELGKPIAEIFQSFEEKAIASASIGQVHKAVLHDGQSVVVKVQHPGVDKTLAQDMMTLTQMSWAFGLLEKGLNFGPILVEWQKAAANELDFRFELQFQERAREAVAKSGLDVIIPKCYPQFTTKRVMVMEFCEGFKITDLEKLDKYNVDRDLLMTKICKSFAYQIHVDGMFNGDPHPGNILVQIDADTGEPRPVLLDWGLVKSFTESERIAFAKTVYSVATLDVMGLMAAFEDMGFRFKTSSVVDPEIYMDALRIGFFRESGSTVEDAQAVSSAAADSGITKKSVMEKNPIDDWPKDIIFFIRVASLLHGLSLQLNASIPFLQLLVDKARQCLVERYVPCSPRVYTRYPPDPGGVVRSAVEWRIQRFLKYLFEKRKLILGCQVAIVHDGRLVVDTCIGRMGPVNMRPVQRDSLFCPMAVCNGLLATSVLKLIDSGQLKLTDRVSDVWDGFIRYNKEHITVEDVLAHRSGMHQALLQNLTLTQLADYEQMVSIFENAIPAMPMGPGGGRYAYLTSGWLLSELVRGTTSQRIDEYFKRFVNKMGLSNELFYPLPEALLKVAVAADRRTAVREKAVPLTLDLGAQAELATETTTTSRMAEVDINDLVRGDTFKERVAENLKARLADSRRERSSSPSSPENRPSIVLLGTSEIPLVVLDQSAPIPPGPPPTTKSTWLAGRGTVPVPAPVPAISPDVPARPNILSRLTSSRREIGVARISNEELQSKLNAVKQAVAMKKAGQDGGKYTSKYYYRLLAQEKHDELPSFVSAIELAKLKPHILDPLIYDSRRLMYLLIPSMNCRATARALAKFYGQLSSGRLLSRHMLEQAATERTVDPSLDAILLTGGGSRRWGLGYQLYPCVRAEPTVQQPPAEQPSRSRVAFDNPRTTTPLTTTGLGHGDLSGSVAMCFPDLKLSIAILFNDILTGPVASQELLRFCLQCFGLEPAWDTPYTLEQAVADVHQCVQDQVVADYSSSATIKQESGFYVANKIPASTVGGIIPV